MDPDLAELALLARIEVQAGIDAIAAPSGAGSMQVSAVRITLRSGHLVAQSGLVRDDVTGRLRAEHAVVT